MGFVEDTILYVLPQNLHNTYLIALIIFVLFVILSKIFVFFAKRVLLGLTAKTKTKHDDILIETTNTPISWLLVFIGAKIAYEYIDYAGNYAWIINNIIISLVYISTAIVIIAIIAVIIDSWGAHVAKKTKSTIDDALVPLFKKSSKAILLLLVAIMVLGKWGVDVTGLLAGVGIAGIAIGFAVKDSLANIFGGVSLLMDKAFGVDDKIELDDGTIGIVQDIGIRSTRIRTFDNEILIIPNGILANSKIKNFFQPNMRARVVVHFGVEYGSDPDKVKKLVLKEIKSMNDILDDPEPDVRFLEMADFSLNMQARFWVDDAGQVFNKKEEATTKIYNLLNKHKIGIPFPTQTVYVQK